MTKEIRVYANWKMNKTVQESLDFLKGLHDQVLVSGIAMPALSIYPCVQHKPPMISIGAQNIHFESSGPYTGEISAEMIKDAGADFVILGHSERRHLFAEDNAFINKKVKHALMCGLQVVLCLGETHTEKQHNLTENIIRQQLFESLFELTDEQLSQVTLAYEPVWAIGTGIPSTPQEAQKTHFLLRGLIEQRWGKEIAEKIYILHGGSIKPDNVEHLVQQQDIDGVLVGGASLNVQSFKEIIQITGNVKK